MGVIWSNFQDLRGIAQLLSGRTALMTLTKRLLQYSSLLLINALTKVFAASVDMEFLYRPELTQLKHTGTTDSGHVSGHVLLAIYHSAKIRHCIGKLNDCRLQL